MKTGLTARLKFRGTSARRVGPTTCGRASANGNAELRLRAAHVPLVAGDLGVFGIADAGRVFAADDPSDAWHVGLGGGVWLAPLTRAHTITLALVRGRERTGVYLRSGFAY